MNRLVKYSLVIIVSLFSVPAFSMERPDVVVQPDELGIKLEQLDKDIHRCFAVVKPDNVVRYLAFRRKKIDEDSGIGHQEKLAMINVIEEASHYFTEWFDALLQHCEKCQFDQNIEDFLFPFDDKNDSVLMRAIKMNDDGAFVVYLINHIGIDFVDSRGRTLLHYAVLGQNGRLVRWLIAQRKDALGRSVCEWVKSI